MKKLSVIEESKKSFKENKIHHNDYFSYEGGFIAGIAYAIKELKKVKKWVNVIVGFLKESRENALV